VRYLHWLRSQCPNQKEIHLILDMYSVHRSEGSKTVARQLSIQLHFIPPGWTDEPQPLDRYIFGALKSTWRKLFHHHHQFYDDDRTRKPDAIRFLIEAWESLNADIARKVWGIYEDVHGGPDDDESDDPDWDSAF
jgi:hypothetical protein